MPARCLKTMFLYKLVSTFGLFFSLTYLAIGQQKSTLSIDQIMQDPKWIGTQPNAISWSADGNSVYFRWNPEKNLFDSVYQMFASKFVPFKAGKEVDFEVQAGKGTRSKDGNKIAFIHLGDLYLRDLKTNRTIKITKTLEEKSNPVFLNYGFEIAFQKTGNVFVWSQKDGSIVQVTDFRNTKKPSTKFGALSARDSLQSQEELGLMQVLKERKQKTELSKLANQKAKTDTIPRFYTDGKQVQNLGISPDGRFISYQLFEPPAKLNPTQVPSYVNESGFTKELPARENVGYPQGNYSFFLFDLLKDSLISFPVSELPGIYDKPDYLKDYPNRPAPLKPLPRGIVVNAVFWNEPGNKAIVEVSSQDNKDRWLMLWNASTSRFTLADRQRDEAWIGGPAAESGVEWINNEQICYLSEATGYAHLYFLDLKSGTKTRKTSGKFEIQKMELSVDKNWVFLLSNAPHPGEQHWYRISVKADSKMEQITRMNGGYEISMSPDNKWIAYRYSYSNNPWELYFQENKPGSNPVQVTFKARSSEFSAYPWRDPELVNFSASDGAKVYARLYKPETAKKNGATVIFVHGAGYLQNAHKRWSNYFREYMFHNLLTDLGYTVIDVDYRGSSGYGRDCRTGIYRHMGGKDLEDHADAVKYLIQNQQVDPQRIGIYGGSYGGFITLMALFTKPGMFKAGAALRSVTDWAHYNHGYTSNILNEPQNDSLAYRRSSPIYFAEGLQDRLLMCHGMVDVNVHFQDVVRLSQRLIELKKENWELAVYPVEDHGFVEPSSWADEYKRILKLFQDELVGK